MSNQTDRPRYPEPFVVKSRGEHRQSLVLLHGRGSNGEKFGTAFLDSPTSLEIPGAVECSRSTALGAVFPHAKFVFPTARKRRARWYNRATICQWFDGVPIDEQDAGISIEEEKWQLEGLRQSRSSLKSIVDKEVYLVGAANVFIGGLSQGCAMGLHLLLSYEESSPLAGFVGMSGWLPFADALEALVRLDPARESGQNEHLDDDDDDDDDNPFATSDTEEPPLEDGRRDLRETDTASQSTAVKVRNLVRDNMDLPPLSSSLQPSWLSTPVLLGHGKRDEKVLVAKGLRAADYLREIGVQVTWKEYDEGHWYAVPEEIDDIVEFVRACLS